MELFDTHAHYNDEKFDFDREEILGSIYKSEVKNLVNAGYSLDSSKRAIEIAKKYDWMYVICGISPNDIPDNKNDIDLQLVELEKIVNGNLYKSTNVESVENKIENIKETAKKNKKIVAIGEIGLDYYWNKENKELQKYAFIKQIEMANKLNLPIVIHTREATLDTINILKSVNVEKKGIFHCAPLNGELIKEGLKLRILYIICWTNNI